MVLLCGGDLGRASRWIVLPGSWHDRSSACATPSGRLVFELHGECTSAPLAESLRFAGYKTQVSKTTANATVPTECGPASRSTRTCQLRRRSQPSRRGRPAVELSDDLGTPGPP